MSPDAPWLPHPPWNTARHLADWRNGDPAAFAALHEHFTPLLHHRIRNTPAWHLLSHHLTLDDVTQEIWARAVPAANRNYTNVGPGSFLAFLGTIADRTLVDLARTHKARKRGGAHNTHSLQPDDEAHSVPRPQQHHEESPTSHARANELEQLARDTLSPREHAAWDLVELQGFTGDEAALALHCTASAVRGLLLRARAKLVARLGNPPNPPAPPKPPAS